MKTDQGLSSHVAWRVAFIVPFILIVSTAFGMLVLCDDTPTGKWSERHNNAQRLANSAEVTAVSQSGPASSGTTTPELGEKRDMEKGSTANYSHSQPRQGEMVDVAVGEVVVAPTLKHTLHVITSPQTLFHCATYFCSFGGELAINSYLGAYYLKNFPYLGQTQAGRWASMFGLLNVVTRPLGGIIADILFKHTQSLWVKKCWILFVGIVSGAFLIAIGLTDPSSESMMFGLIAGMAIFLEAGNGANFALVPHVHPTANGVLSGTVGAVGNLGGVVFAIVFRYHHADYATSFWITGVMIIGMNLILCWVKPLPKCQR